MFVQTAANQWIEMVIIAVSVLVKTRCKKRKEANSLKKWVYAPNVEKKNCGGMKSYAWNVVPKATVIQ